MALTSLPLQQFAKDSSKAISAAIDGPVFITDNGVPSHVLLTYTDYLRLRSQETNITARLGMPGIEEIDFDVQKVNIAIRPAEFD